MRPFPHEGSTKKSDSISLESFTHEKATRQSIISRETSEDFNERSPYVCDICDKDCRNKSHLVRHRSSKHSNGKLFKCNTCQDSFKWESTLRNHQILTHERDLTKLLSCQHCDKKFPSKSLLDSHLLMHSEERPFSCQICGITFKRLSTQRRHNQVVHNPREDFKCNFPGCEKTFKSKNYLKNHVRNRHSQKSQIKCSKCNVMLKNEKSCKAHEKLCKDGNKREKYWRYQCSNCDKKFLYPKDVKRHEKTHEL